MPSRREGPPDPLGKRALFWVPPVTEGSAEPAFVEGIDEEPAYGGERTIHSAAPPMAGGPRGDDGRSGSSGRFVVVCQRCSETSVLGARDLLMFQFPVGVWLPRGRYDRRMTCPSCRKRAWCSVSLRRG